MNRLPPDMPDEGPTIPARFRVYPEPAPTSRDTFGAILLALAGLVIGLGSLAIWALQ